MAEHLSASPKPRIQHSAWGWGGGDSAEPAVIASWIEELLWTVCWNIGLCVTACNGIAGARDGKLTLPFYLFTPISLAEFYVVEMDKKWNITNKS